MLRFPVKVLIVDSDRALSARVSEFLQGMGSEVRFCCNCTEARQQLSLFSPDILLSEALFEDGSGFDLHSEAAKHSIPTVFFSEETQVRNVIEALRVGVSDYILKPLDDFTVVARVLEKALKVSRLETEQSLDRKALQRLSGELMQHLRALEHDQEAGRIVQKKLMPDTPAELAGIKVNYEILPSSHLSGDTVDFGLFSSRYLAFYLLDVSGHGAASAFVAVWVKQIVRGFFKGVRSGSSGQSLDQHIPSLLALINQQLIEAGVDKHLTCFVGVIDTHTMDLSYVVAGHLPLPVLVTPDGADVIEGTGKPLGIFTDAQWPPKRLKLPKLFSLLVCSDGVFEMLPSGNLDEKEECMLKRLKDHSPRSIDQLKSMLEPLTADALPDDVAMLLLSNC